MILNNIKNDSEGVDDEVEGALLIDDLDEESLPSKGEDTAESVISGSDRNEKVIGN